MPATRTARLLARTVLLLGVCAASGGCSMFSGWKGFGWGGSRHSSPAQNPPPAAGPVLAPPVTPAPVAYPAARLAPRTDLEWAIQSQDQGGHPVMTGRATVGPDGTIVLGPYGTFRVVEMTVPEATTAIEQGLQQWVRGPRVSLRLAGDQPNPATRTWTSTGGGATTAAYQPPDWGGRHDAAPAHSRSPAAAPPQPRHPEPAREPQGHKRGPVLRWLLGES